MITISKEDYLKAICGAKSTHLPEHPHDDTVDASILAIATGSEWRLESATYSRS